MTENSNTEKKSIDINSAVKQYNANEIKVLKGLEAVRERPGMYVGGTDTKALHHLVYEIVDNAIDEALGGYCDDIEVTIHKDESISVADNGRGIPVDIQPDMGISALEVVLTTLHAGAKFGGGSYKVSGGLHGVGSSAVNALSKWMEARVYRDGKIYFQRYERGIPVKDKNGKKIDVRVIGECSPDKHGTEISFRFDDDEIKDSNGKVVIDPATGNPKKIFDKDIFDENGQAFNFNTLVNRFREMAFVTKKTKIHLTDERNDREETFYFQGGITSFVHYLNLGKTPVHPIIHAEKTINGVGIDVAIQYTDVYTETVYSFANTIYTVDGGTHLTGLRTAITRVINDYAHSSGLLKDTDSNFSGDDTREGMTAVVSIKHPDPQFESQTKVKLMNTEVSTYVQQVVQEAFKDYLENNPAAGRAIVTKCLTSSRARDAAMKARDLVLRKGILDSMTLPGKLADCSGRDPSKCEIYIVEGDSAGGSAKQGRDRSFQAILPLRGKILNTERTRLDKMLANNEIKAMISAFGCGIDSKNYNDADSGNNDANFDIAKLRYGKIIIMTDADVDGSHIRTLLLTFFFRYMPELITQGHVFIAQPPLYRIAYKGKIYYSYTDQQRDEKLKELGSGAEKAAIQRYKGLGEMNPEQLWDTTMNPQYRTLLQVTVDDIEAASKTFTMLMGEEVPPRTRFIQTHAAEVQNLDI